MEHTRYLTYPTPGQASKLIETVDWEGNEAKVLFVAHPSVVARDRLVLSWVREPSLAGREGAWFLSLSSQLTRCYRSPTATKPHSKAEAYPRIFYDKLVPPVCSSSHSSASSPHDIGAGLVTPTSQAPNKHRDVVTMSRVLNDRCLSNLLLVEVRESANCFVNYRLSLRDSIVLVFSFNSRVSFEVVREKILQLRPYDPRCRPVVALIGTAACTEDREVDNDEIDGLKIMFPMFYCEVTREDEAFPVMDAIASVLKPESVTRNAKLWLSCGLPPASDPSNGLSRKSPNTRTGVAIVAVSYTLRLTLGHVLMGGAASLEDLPQLFGTQGVAAIQIGRQKLVAFSVSSGGRGEGRVGVIPIWVLLTTPPPINDLADLNRCHPLLAPLVYMDPSKSRSPRPRGTYAFEVRARIVFVIALDLLNTHASPSSLPSGERDHDAKREEGNLKIAWKAYTPHGFTIQKSIGSFGVCAFLAHVTCDCTPKWARYAESDSPAACSLNLEQRGSDDDPRLSAIWTNGGIKQPPEIKERKKGCPPPSTAELRVGRPALPALRHERLGLKLYDATIAEMRPFLEQEEQARASSMKNVFTWMVAKLHGVDTSFDVLLSYTTTPDVDISRLKPFCVMGENLNRDEGVQSLDLTMKVTITIGDAPSCPILDIETHQADPFCRFAPFIFQLDLNGGSVDEANINYRTACKLMSSSVSYLYQDGAEEPTVMSFEAYPCDSAGGVWAFGFPKGFSGLLRNHEWSKGDLYLAHRMRLSSTSIFLTTLLGEAFRSNGARKISGVEIAYQFHRGSSAETTFPLDAPDVGGTTPLHIPPHLSTEDAGITPPTMANLPGTAYGDHFQGIAPISSTSFDHSLAAQSPVVGDWTVLRQRKESRAAWWSSLSQGSSSFLPFVPAEDGGLVGFSM
ncbi:hypothetical protein FA13DRAFT_1720939 [Coprinellus micaceus]|uniref:Uncharacterized protein n=1 Tax=Coprinellus micaceus TaxID=71717 RepID=A0A4Y7S4M6_COPMI|nr:hypothetical protein FA13DRAFT_1720939 [Coprinellus micaceus]